LRPYSAKSENKGELTHKPFDPMNYCMTNRLKPFSTAELRALLFSLDIAATAEPLTPESDQIRQQLVEMNSKTAEN